MGQFEKILLETDKVQENNFKKNKDKKISLFKGLKKEAEKYIGTISQQQTGAFLNNPKSYLIDKIKKGNPLDLAIKDEKLLFLLDIDLTKFNGLLNRYKDNPVELHYKDWKVQPIEQPDTGKTFTENERQNKEYKEALNLLRVFKDFYFGNDTHANNNYLRKFKELSNGKFKFDREGNLIPSAYHILKIK